MTWEIRHGDCIEQMAQMDEASVDAIVCDPPYGLEFMGKEWDRLRADVGGRDDLRASLKGERQSGGEFGERIGIQYGTPNKNPRCRRCYKLKHDHAKGRCKCERPDWDLRKAEYGYAMQWWHEAWATEALRVLRPGGHLLAFGGTRTYHRLACAIEDAGFEIRDSLMWLYGSGFPKSLDVGKAIDRAAGAEREVVGRHVQSVQDRKLGNALEGSKDGSLAWQHDLTAPATPEAQQWNGWGTALKPAWENVVCAVKPSGESETIRGSLCELRAKLLSLSPAKPAGKSSTSRQAEPDDPDLLASAGWTADERSSSRDALCEAMGTSLFESALTSSLSIVSSWLGILYALCGPRNTSTTETASDTTTDLRTLSSCLSGLTLPAMLEAATSPDGSDWSALPAAVAFSAVASRLNATQTLSALAAATSPAQESSQDAGANQAPIVLARKPLAGTVAANVLEYGTGALNVDGCRVGFAGKADERESKDKNRHGDFGTEPGGNAVYGDYSMVERTNYDPSGRWPANLVLSHHPDCEQVGMRRVKTATTYEPDGKPMKRSIYGKTGTLGRVLTYADPDGYETIPEYRCVEGCPVRELDGQSGCLISGRGQVTKGYDASPVYGDGDVTFRSVDRGYGDSGGASRFFYVAKSSRRERQAGLNGLSDGDGKTCVCDRDQRASTPAAAGTPRARATTEDISTGSPDSLTIGSGSKPTDQSPKASRFTTSTETSKTTDSKTSGSLTPPRTSGSTPHTSASATKDGSADAPSAANGNEPTPRTSTRTSEAGFSTDGADPAISLGSSATSAAANNVCPDCGGVRSGALRNSHPT